MSSRGAQGSAARPGIRPAARLSSGLQHMLGYEGVLQLFAGVHGCSSRVCEVCSHFDRAKVNTSSWRQQLQLHRARGWGKVAPQEGFAIRRGECNIMTPKET